MFDTAAAYEVKMFIFDVKMLIVLSDDVIIFNNCIFDFLGKAAHFSYDSGMLSEVLIKFAITF